MDRILIPLLIAPRASALLMLIKLLTAKEMILKFVINTILCTLAKYLYHLTPSNIINFILVAARKLT